MLPPSLLTLDTLIYFTLASLAVITALLVTANRTYHSQMRALDFTRDLPGTTLTEEEYHSFATQYARQRRLTFRLVPILTPLAFLLFFSGLAAAAIIILILTSALPLRYLVRTHRFFH